MFSDDFYSIEEEHVASLHSSVGQAKKVSNSNSTTRNNYDTTSPLKAPQNNYLDRLTNNQSSDVNSELLVKLQSKPKPIVRMPIIPKIAITMFSPAKHDSTQTKE